MSTNYYLTKNKPTACGGLHIGLSSCGWRFLFREYHFWEVERQLNTFEQWRDYLKETTESGSHVIVDEYDRIVSLEDFLLLVENKQKEEKPDMFDDCKNVNGYRFSSREFF